MRVLRLFPSQFLSRVSFSLRYPPRVAWLLFDILFAFSGRHQTRNGWSVS